MLVTIFHHSCGNLRPMNICWGCGGLFSSVPRHRHNGHQTDVIMKMMSQNKESRYMAPHFNVLDLTRLGSSSELRRPPRWGRAGIGLIICSRQPRSISIRDTAPVIRTWFSSTAASDADIQQRLELLHYVRQAAHFRGEFSHMLENLPHSLKVGLQLVKKNNNSHNCNMNQPPFYVMLPILITWRWRDTSADCGTLLMLQHWSLLTLHRRWMWSEYCGADWANMEALK